MFYINKHEIDYLDSNKTSKKAFFEILRRESEELEEMPQFKKSNPFLRKNKWQAYQIDKFDPRLQPYFGEDVLAVHAWAKFKLEKLFKCQVTL